MTGPQLDPTVSLGNLLVVATMLVSMAGAWAVTSERGTTNASAIATIQAEANALEARVRVLENTISAQTGQLTNINDSLRDLRMDVKRLLEQGK
jgi:hypothetical protein